MDLDLLDYFLVDGGVGIKCLVVEPPLNGVVPSSSGRGVFFGGDPSFGALPRADLLRPDNDALPNVLDLLAGLNS